MFDARFCVFHLASLAQCLCYWLLMMIGGHIKIKIENCFLTGHFYHLKMVI